jgi:DNA polymerase (family 10)
LTNGQIIEILELTISLMELHEENAFKIRALQNAVFNLDKLSQPLGTLAQEELAAIEGVGKGIAAKIAEINASGTTQELQQYLAQTPVGVLDLLKIKGIGPKKVRTLWKEQGIESLGALEKACVAGEVALLKGFGAKTQETILKSVRFIQQSLGKFLYAEIEPVALAIEEKLKALSVAPFMELSGAVRRKMEVVEYIQFVAAADDRTAVVDALDTVDWLQKNEATSGPFVWRGHDKESGHEVEIKVYLPDQGAVQWLINSSGQAHRQALVAEGKNAGKDWRKSSFESEEAVYAALGMAYIVPEYREGFKEIQQAKENTLPELLKLDELKGIFHNHTTYSDGKNTLEEMAVYCRDLGYQYLGISDHSKTAAYANGLQEYRVVKQQEEIDVLNCTMAPFRIFKGIESDILADGSLDYSEEVLKTFDFIVASIHSGLNMDVQKATDRLITAIENPYTTMLGHMTGRLLLRREGYPVDHRKIIDACAENNVIIEINAHPYRLDMDWRWIDYALDKGVVLSINPDAHETAGYHDMKYGVYTARKGGLTASQTFNAWPLEKIEAWLAAKKK